MGLLILICYKYNIILYKYIIPMSDLQNNIFQSSIKDTNKIDSKRYEDSQTSQNIFRQTFRKNQEVEEFNYKDNKKKPEKTVKDETSSYYGLSEGMITFGKNPLTGMITQNLKENDNVSKDNVNENSMKRTASFKRQKNQGNNMNTNSESTSGFNQTPSFNRTGKNEKNSSVCEREGESEKSIKDDDDFSTNIPDKFGGIGIINRINDNNSHMVVVVQTIWNLQILRNYLIYDMNISDNDVKNRFLFILKETMTKYSQNLNSSSKKLILIDQLRNSLAELFSSSGKFSSNCPDDPVDVYFAILNSLHSFYNKKKLNEIHDNSCNTRCVVHKYFWMDLSKKEECECKGFLKRLYSYHNYIFDIEMKCIIEIAELLGKQQDFNKCVKLNVNKFNYDIGNLNQLKSNLFVILKILVNQGHTNCPEKGVRCSINKIHKQLYLTSLPFYFSFNLLSSFSFQNTTINILKTLILIPLKLDIGTVFEHTSFKSCYFLLGGINRTQSRTYTCFFSQKNSHNEREWIYYCDDNITYFKSWFDLITKILKNKEIPVIIFYQMRSKKDNFSEKEMTRENIESLENYAVQVDNVQEVPSIRFRPLEDVIRHETISTLEFANSSEVKALISNNSENKFKRNQPISNSTNNTSNSSLELNEYICGMCTCKNKIETVFCGKCGYNNENIIKESLRKKKQTEKGATPFEVERVSKKDKEESSNTEQNPFKKENKKILNYNNSTNEIITSNSKLEKIDKELNKISSDIIKHLEKPFVSNQGVSIDDEKSKDFLKVDLNLPKQIKSNSKKEIPIKIEKPISKIVRDICNLCFETKCVCEKIKEERQSSLKPKEKEVEDRIRPYSILKEVDRKSKKLNRKSDDTEWECEICKEINKINNYRCSKCQNINKIIYEILENQKIPDQNPYKQRYNSESKKISSEVQLKKQNPDISIEQKNALNENQLNKFKRQDCICYKIDEDNLFCNNVCKLCKKPRGDKNKAKKNMDLPLTTNKQLNNNLSNNNLFNKNVENKNNKIETDNYKLFNHNKKPSEVKLQNNNIISNNYFSNNNQRFSKADLTENDNHKLKNRLSNANLLSQEKERIDNYEYRSVSTVNKKEQNSRYNNENNIQSPPFKKSSTLSVNTEKKYSTIESNNNSNQMGTHKSKQLSMDLNSIKLKTMGRDSSAKPKK